VELDEQDVQADQRERHDRQNRHVERVETQQRVAGHVDAAAQKGLDEAADHRKGAGPPRRHADGCKGALVPEQQVAAQTEKDRDAQQDESRHPDHFPRFAVGLQQQRAEEVDEQKDDGQLRPPVVERAEEPSHVQFGDDLDDALVGEFHVRDVVEGHQHPGQKLQNEQKQRDPSGVIPEIVTMFGDELFPGQKSDAPQVVALFEPVFKPWAVQP